MAKIYPYGVYTYDGEHFRISTMHTSKRGACTLAESQIDEICKTKGYERGFNDTGEVQAYIASKDGKIVTARLVKYLFKGGAY